MIVDEQTFFQLSLPGMLEGVSSTFILVANSKLADVYPEGELPIGNTSLKVSVLHSADNGAHIARCILGHTGARMYILYGSQNAFQNMVGVAHSFRSQDPGGTIIIAICDCDKERKRRAFAESIRIKEIDCVVFTPYCGATNFFYSLLDFVKKYTVPKTPNEVTSLP